MQAVRAEDAPVPPPSLDQSAPPSTDVATPDDMGDADPLDVIENQNQNQNQTPEEPTVPQFSEVPAPDAEGTTSESATPPPATEPAASQKAEAPKSLSTEPPSVVGDEPDLKREERFHEIYKKYNESPTSEEAWEKASSSRQSQNYKISKGDTLWDLSNTMFGDPNYWPKVWSLNVGHISNPHEIDPKMTIQFYPGSVEDAPTLSVEEIAENKEIAALTAAEPENQPPVPSKKHVPVLKTLPPSIPLYRYGSVVQPPLAIELGQRMKSIPKADEYLSYYVVTKPPVDVGEIVETEMGMNTATDFQYVIVQLDDNAGKDFVAIRDLDRVKDFKNKERSTGLVEVQGSIEVLEKVNDSKNLYRAIVTKTLQPLAVGARLLAGPLPTFDPSPTPVNSTVSARIIGGQFANDRQQFSSHAIVFLDAGSSDGLQEGQSLNIYSDIRNRNEKSSALLNDRMIGTLKIVRVTENFATAYITHESDDVFVGDHVGTSTIIDSVNRVSSAAAAAAAPADSAASSSGDEDFGGDDSQAAPAVDAPVKADPNAPADPNSKDDLDLEL
jgi:hypothetical protein